MIEVRTGNCDFCGTNSGYVSEIVHRFGKERYTHYVHPHCDKEWYKHILCREPCYLFSKKTKVTPAKGTELPIDPVDKFFTLDVPVPKKVKTIKLNYSQSFPEGCSDFITAYDSEEEDLPYSKIRYYNLNYGSGKSGFADFVSD